MTKVDLLSLWIQGSCPAAAGTCADGYVFFSHGGSGACAKIEDLSFDGLRYQCVATYGCSGPNPISMTCHEGYELVSGHCVNPSTRAIVCYDGTDIGFGETNICPNQVPRDTTCPDGYINSGGGACTAVPINGICPGEGRLQQGVCYGTQNQGCPVGYGYWTETTCNQYRYEYRRCPDGTISSSTSQDSCLDKTPEGVTCPTDYTDNGNGGCEADPTATITYTFTDVRQNHTIHVTFRESIGPIAEFTATPRAGHAPMTVYFTDLSIGDIVEWHWNFGGGSTSNEKNPVYTYSTEGVYTVTLQVRDTNGRVSAYSVPDYILVTSSQLYTVTSSERGGGIAVPTGGPWVIDEDNYAVISFDSRPGHELLGIEINGRLYPKMDYIRLPSSEIPSDENGKYEIVAVGKERDNQIRVNFTADICKENETPCRGTVPLDVTFTSITAGSVIPGEWIWDFGNGERGEGETSTVKYTMPGLYTISLTGKQGQLSGTETKIGYIYVEQK